jgi:hypothetical protein
MLYALTMSLQPVPTVVLTLLFRENTARNSASLDTNLLTTNLLTAAVRLTDLRWRPSISYPSRH